MGRVKFTPVKGLDAIVAARFAAPEVTRVADEVEREAKRLAPPLKRWVSMRDGGVRRQHVHVDGDELPENLRFKLPAYQWDVEHPGRMGPLSTRTGGGGGTGWRGGGDDLVKGAYSYLLHPRDTTAGAYIAVVNCRCRLERDPDGIAKRIDAGPTVITGTRVRAVVTAKGKWVVESHYGVVYQAHIGPLPADGTFYMSQAALNVAARRRARR